MAAFYRRIGDEMIMGAIGPEADADQAGFNRAVQNALRRLEEFSKGTLQ